MGLKEFNADLSAARASETAVIARKELGISDLQRSDCEGQLSFQYAHGALCHPLSIQVLVPDTSTYPRNIGYMLFVDSDIEEENERSLLQVLEKLASSLQDEPIDHIFSIIAKKLSARLDGYVSSDDEGQDDSDGADDEPSFSDDEEEEYDLELDPLDFRSTSSRMTLYGSIAQQNNDLTAAMKAGVSFGVYDRCSSHYGIVSLSIPTYNWATSPEILEAWDLTESDHVVLLIRYCEAGYPSTTDFLESSNPRELLHFSVGKCSQPKPSEQSVRQALAGRQPEDGAHATQQGPGPEDDAEFQPLYLFNSIERILENDLRSLVRIRMKDESLSWCEALTLHFEGSATKKTSSPPSLGPRGPRILREHVMGSTDTMSIPLVAMNCAVYLMVHCGQHCVICGRALGAGFETMRPYVCDGDLCLDQYFSLNLGPGIEHDIIGNPHSVDLLVSFFYSALLSNRVPQFPLSLRLKGIGPRPTADGLNIQARIDYQGNNVGRATFTSDTSGLNQSWVRVGSKVMLVQSIPATVVSPPNQSANAPLWYHNLERYVCNITDVSTDSFGFKVLSFWTGFQNASYPGDQIVYPGIGTMVLPQGPPPEPPNPATAPEGLLNEMVVCPFNTDVSDLTATERNSTLLALLCGLPPILYIRKYLMDNPGHRLASSTQFLDANTYRLLLWIVASNRSFIVQDEPVVAAAGEKLSALVDAPNRVSGIGAGWLQFRFVQGSPEKEYRFAHAVERANGHGDARTFFAWHGSHLSNWHGIVSTGLNFDRPLNGRAHGHGVYFSESFNTSLAYSRTTETGWPNSNLRVSQAISMCEIINKKEEFISTMPHYVVNQLDWIQCRFLFVRVNPQDAAIDPQVSFPQGQKHVGKAKAAFLQGPLAGPGGEPIQIPRSAIPSRLKAEENIEQGKWPISARKSNKRDSAISARDYDIGVDVDGVLAAADEKKDEKTSNYSSPVKRRRTEQATTDFQPGTLDWDSLPKLPDPQNPGRSALKVLMQEFKAVQKTQESTDLVESGWYVDFGSLSETGNMFHWIVELHSFHKDLPLAQDMKHRGCKSIVLELNFGDNYPMSPPFARVIRPRFLEFSRGGGGNVTAGGSICSEMLVSQGWMPTMGIEKVIMQIRLQLCDTERPARLNEGNKTDYTVGEAIDAYRRTATAHGWTVPAGLDQMAAQWANNAG